MVSGILKPVINILLFFLLSTPAIASIGSITDAKGSGQIKRHTATLPATKGSGIEKLDTVITSSQGKFKITFIDATTVNITENSKLIIDDFVYSDKNKSQGRLGLKVALGTVRYASGAIAHNNPRSVNIRTPTATIGVRGTDFVMSVDEIGKTVVVLLPDCFDDRDPGKDITKCPVGEIEVETAAGKVVMNQPFQATVVENASIPPSKPVTINMNGQALNNSLQISSPSTTSGISVADKAKQESKSYSNPATSAASTNAQPSTSPQASSADSSTQSASESSSEATSVTVSQSPTTMQISQTPTSIIVTAPSVASVDNKSSKNPTTEPDSIAQANTAVTPVITHQVQTGWSFDSQSPTKRQVLQVILPIDSGTEVSVSQDGVTNYYNFSNGGQGRPTGSIVIIQRSSQ